MLDAPSGINANAFCAVNSTPFTLVSKIESYSSSVTLPKAAYFAIPAFAKRISSLPFSSFIRYPFKKAVEIFHLRHVTLRAGYIRADYLHGGSELGPTPTGDINVCPLFCQGLRGSQADSASAACYQRYLSVQFSHSVTLRCSLALPRLTGCPPLSCQAPSRPRAPRNFRRQLRN